MHCSRLSCSSKTFEKVFEFGRRWLYSQTRESNSRPKSQETGKSWPGRYQKGSIRKRGTRNPVWELQWWTDEIQADGSLGRKRESKVLGFLSSMNKRQAMKVADEFLRPLNLGKITPFATIVFRDFIEKHFVPNAFPTLKTSTR